MQVNDTYKSRRGTAILAVICLLLQFGISPAISLGLGTINFAFIFVAYIALSKGGSCFPRDIARRRIPRQALALKKYFCGINAPKLISDFRLGNGREFLGIEAF